MSAPATPERPARKRADAGDGSVLDERSTRGTPEASRATDPLRAGARSLVKLRGQEVAAVEEAEEVQEEEEEKEEPEGHGSCSPAARSPSPTMGRRGDQENESNLRGSREHVGGQTALTKRKTPKTSLKPHIV